MNNNAVIPLLFKFPDVSSCVTLEVIEYYHLHKDTSWLYKFCFKTRHIIRDNFAGLQ